MTDSEIKCLIEKAKKHARKKGYGQFEDDFAQEAYLRIRSGFKTSLRNIFTDFLRKDFGDTRLVSGRLKSGARHRGESIDGLHSGLCNGQVTGTNCGVGFGTDAGHEHNSWRSRLNFNSQKDDVYHYLFVEELSEQQTADLLGVTESRISQIKAEIKKDVKKALAIDGLWDQFHYDKNSSLIQIDWL